MPDDTATVLETHISWVYLVGDRAYKRKKPVRTAFLDYSTTDRRADACAEEVRLGRRLAPDVYLGVEPVPGDDWAVVMRRMPLDRRLSSLVGAGADVSDAVREIARRVAALHLRSGRLPAADAAASAGATLARWEANHAELAASRDRLAATWPEERALELAREYVAGRGPLFTERIAAGRAVDGHGDLSPEDIFVLPDGPRILDPIEFDPQLRYGDGLADVAFLAMHLERLGAVQASADLLAWYGEFAADHWPASLAHFFIAYRAQVRAKVACLSAAQRNAVAAPEADAFLELAVDHLEAGRTRLVLVGGPPATGKTTVATAVADANDWVMLRSDDVRKELAGIPSTAPAAAPLMAGVYTPAMTALTYGELLHRARWLLERGESTVLDATWGDATWRDEARRVASAAHAGMIELRCAAPVELAAHRAAERGPDASDAGPDIAVELASRFDAWPEATGVDTTGAPAESCRRALDLVSRLRPGAVPAVG
ncbi:MAG TPA: AAA family ATPase [Acidimicrobiales bacterium]|nr:AAA family ATPase [Acidimicrobiales bacterium]